MSGVTVRLHMLDQLVDLDTHTIVMRDDGTLHRRDGQMTEGRLTGHDGLLHTVTQQRTEDLPESDRINNLKVLGAIYDHIRENIPRSAFQQLGQMKIGGLTLDDHLTRGTTVSSSLVRELRQITHDVVTEDNDLQEKRQLRFQDKLMQAGLGNLRGQVAPGLLEQSSKELREGNSDQFFPSRIDERMNERPETVDLDSLLEKAGLYDKSRDNYLPPEPSRFGDIQQLRKLGGGAMGDAFLARVDGKECVLKTWPVPQLLSLERTEAPNEAMGSYLVPRHDDQDRPYLTSKVNIAQPTFYLVSVLDGERREDKMVAPHAMRDLVNSGSNVVCHGLIMPKANGEAVDRLVEQGKLTDSEKKQLIGSTLLSIKGLNERGFVHRDLKPENSYFDRETGKTTLIDTGSLFKTPELEDRYIQYKDGQLVGTPTYVHPRAVRNQRHGTETDLYALGVMTLKVDHPKALDHLHGAIVANSSSGLTKDWLLAQLNDEIEKVGPGELKDDLVALREHLDDPRSLSGFAMQCFAKASEPAKDWNDREWAQRTYSELLTHPGLQ